MLSNRSESIPVLIASIEASLVLIGSLTVPWFLLQSKSNHLLYGLCFSLVHSSRCFLFLIRFIVRQFGSYQCRVFAYNRPSSGPYLLSASISRKLICHLVLLPSDPHHYIPYRYRYIHHTRLISTPNQFKSLSLFSNSCLVHCCTLRILTSLFGSIPCQRFSASALLISFSIIQYAFIMLTNPYLNYDF